MFAQRAENSNFTAATASEALFVFRRRIWKALKPAVVHGAEIVFLHRFSVRFANRFFFPAVFL